MIGNPRRKLIEVALPLEAINAASAREKSIRHGHPSTLHLWWARRPLAACRAVLFAQLVDDPSSWPERFSTEEDQKRERERLHRLIERLVPWEASNDEGVLNEARFEIARSIAWGRAEEPPDENDSEAVRRYLLDKAPPVYDPFCGGGSIPLEAQRLGLRAYGSDLNPVAVMISKALVEFPPKFAGLPPVNPESRRKLANGGVWNAKGAQGLAEDVRYYGKWMRDEAEKRIGNLYPKVRITPELAAGWPDLKGLVGQELTVIAWLWARTVASPNPACRGAHVPLVSSFMLSTKPGKEAWVEPVLDAAARDGYRLEVRRGRLSDQDAKRLKVGTVGREGAVCVLSGSPIPLSYIRSVGRAGRLRTRLMAVVAESAHGRQYLSPQLDIERVAQVEPPADRPDAEIEHWMGCTNCVVYGLTNLGNLFTPRQATAVKCFSDLVGVAREKILEDLRVHNSAAPAEYVANCSCGTFSYADAVAVYLAFCVDKLADLANSLCRWEPIAQCPRQLFARQAMPMVWDFAEANVFSTSSGSWQVLIDGIHKAMLASLMASASAPSAHIVLRDAQTGIQSREGMLVSTDPPYYANVPYSNLSDFFYIWLRSSLRHVLPSMFGSLLVPRAGELVANQGRHGGLEKAEAFFLTGMSRAIDRMVQVASGDTPIAIYYALKQAEVEREGVASTGWATFLAAVIGAGLSIDGTWPVRTENASRMRGQNSNALASSIVLVCRKRPEGAPSVTRGEFLHALRAELPGALRTLQESAIAPVDMAQASIGPGMAVFSRYKAVLEADDKPMSVREALRIINAELDEYLARQEGDYDRWTRFAVTWFQQHQFGTGRYGEAETLAKARDVAVQGVVEAGILEAKAGKVRLLRRDELPEDYVPFRDSRQTVWEGRQHLIKRLQGGGEEDAARLAKQLGYQAELARDLAYRLFQICERNKWAEEARAYNGLVESWREIMKIVDTLSDQTAPGPAQAELAV